MNNVLVIIYPYRELDLVYTFNLDESEFLEEDNVIINELKNIDITTPLLCNHIDECDCVLILNIYENSNINVILDYIDNNIQNIIIVSYNTVYKTLIKQIINNVNNNISILQLFDHKYIYDILKSFTIINNITISDTVKEIIIEASS